MKETKNLHLKKPDPEDFYNIEDFNANMDILDADQASQDEAILAIQEELEAAYQALEQAQTRLTAAEQAIAGHTTAIQGHTGNNTIHVTQDEKDSWNAKAATGPQGPAGKNGTAYYGVCASGVDEEAKVVPCDGFELTIGAVIVVYFVNTNSASSPTLNVNGTGAKKIVAARGASPEPYWWGAMQMVEFAYNGTCWAITNANRANSTYWGVTKLNNTVTSTATDVAATANAVKTAYDKANAALPKAGGTMTGALTLAAAPTANMQAANKGYVDNWLTNQKLRLYSLNLKLKSYTIDSNTNILTGIAQATGFPSDAIQNAFMISLTRLSYTYTNAPQFSLKNMSVYGTIFYPGKGMTEFNQNNILIPFAATLPSDFESVKQDQELNGYLLTL